MVTKSQRSKRPRAHLSHELDAAMRHLAVDLERSVGELLADGAHLILKLHSRSLPGPPGQPTASEK
jgi:hypothetical protein